MKLNLWQTTRRAILASAVAGFMLPAQAQQHTYTVSVSLDYTGPFANVMDSWWAGQQAVFEWWNETRGKNLGVNLVIKTHDMRYDPSVVARTWPQVLSSDKPIVFLGMGTPDLVSLMKRLPNDKVPMIMGTAMVGPLWTADGWHFSYRPTYSHEFAGLFGYLQERLSEKRALRIGTVSTQGLAGYVDQVNGTVALAKAYPNRFEVVSSQWVDNQPITITSQIQEMAKAKPDVILVGTNTAQVVATAKALKELGLKIPIVTSSHNGLTEAAKAIPLADLEGSYSVFAFAPYNDPAVKVADIFAKYNKVKNGTWGITAAQTAGQALLAVAAVEKAVAAVGAGKLSGQAIYDALLSGPYSADYFHGLMPAMQLKRDAPFPTDNLAVKAMTVKNGKLEAVSKDWMPVPALAKW